MTIVLRDYQHEAIHDIRAAYKAAFKRVLLTLATGSGKTVIFTYVAAGIHAKGKRVLILAHRDELLVQIGKALRQWDVPHSFLRAGVIGVPNSPVLVAGVFTAVKRLKGIKAPDLIVCDEAHHATGSTTWGRILAAFPAAKVLGVTATPVRLDGTGLDECFEALVTGPSTADLIERGHLSRPDVYAPPTKVDLSGVHRVGGDYNRGELATAMDKPKITGSAVEHYKKLAPGSAAVAFCVSIAHAEHVAAEFQAAGFTAASVDGKMDMEKRRRVLADFEHGKIQVLTSCDLISEGFDLPRIETAILLRPTQSLGLYLQQVGRSLRPYPGKERALILDHVGNCRAHGLPDERRDWSLQGLPPEKRKPPRDGAPLRTCPVCFAVHTPAPVCPRCNHVYVVKSRKLEQEDGTLRKVNGVERPQPDLLLLETLRRDFGYLQEKGERMGYRPNWAKFVAMSKIKKAVAAGKLPAMDAWETVKGWSVGHGSSKEKAAGAAT